MIPGLVLQIHFEGPPPKGTHRILFGRAEGEEVTNVADRDETGTFGRRRVRVGLEVGGMGTQWYSRRKEVRFVVGGHNRIPGF